MILTPLPRLTALALTCALTLSACSDGAAPADLEASDAALTGVAAEGGLAPVAARAVRVGLNGKDKAACGTPVNVTGTVDVRWSNSAEGPTKARISGTVAPCEIDGDWTGIVFPAAGQDADACAVDVSVGSVREYQGPCRWGWVESAKLTATAG